MKHETERICETWYKACNVFADKFGTPLPKEILKLGDLNKGWGIELNATREDQKDFKAYSMNIWWNGFPAGIIDPGGGVIAVGGLANENSLIEWLEAIILTEVS